MEKEVCKQQCLFRPTDVLPTNKKALIHFHLSLTLRFPSLVSPLTSVLFRFQGMEQYPPHTPGLACSWSPSRTF